MRTRYRKILVAAALTALALTAIFATAANAATPAPPYQDFAGCPSRAENPFVAECIKFTFSNGEPVTVLIGASCAGPPAPQPTLRVQPRVASRRTSLGIPATPKPRTKPLTATT